MTEITAGELSVTLPWPPSVNGYWQPLALGGKRVTMMLTQRARLYRTDVHEVIRAKLGHLRIAVFTCPVRVDIELRAPDRRRRDIDNHVKGMLDALVQAKVLEDDYLVDELVVRRGLQLKDGAANVIISPLGPTPGPQPAQQRLGEDDGEEDRPF